MTTSSSDRSRCTRISPSAVLDDRLDGKDLEWARDHLRRCEACRDRVEDFREMLLRVGRLPSAAVGAAAMDQAYAVSIPERLQGQAGTRSFEIEPAESLPGITPLPELPTPMRPEVTSVPDLLSELEREIFGDEPAVDHPTPLTSSPEAARPAFAAPPVEEMVNAEPEPMPFTPAVEPLTPEPEVEPQTWRQVEIDSHREVEHLDWDHQQEPAPATPEPVPVMAAPVPPPLVALPEPEPVAWQPEPESEPEPAAVAESRNVVYGQDPASFYPEDDAPPTTPARKPDTAMRIAVGLGAAACVLLAAVLYEGGWLAKGIGTIGARNTAATAAVRASAVHPSPSIRTSASPSAAPTAPPAPVLFTLGNGVGGGTVFRIRPGTAVAGYTRLVFDIHGGGLPTMVITQPDAMHVAVTFKDTSATDVPVNGIHSYQVAAVEPAVQQGPDGNITVDLARPVRVTAFTLAATGSYAWRLVVDLHTN
jgi:hypothetical protein